MDFPQQNPCHQNVRPFQLKFIKDSVQVVIHNYKSAIAQLSETGMTNKNKVFFSFQKLKQRKPISTSCKSTLRKKSFERNAYTTPNYA